MYNLPIILASASRARLELLGRIKITPDQILPADIDESEHKGELPIKLAGRLAVSKAITIANRLDEAVIIAADTVASTGRTTLPKALTADDVRFCLNKVSGRRHRVYTGVCIIKKSDKKMQIRERVVMSTVKFKVLTKTEIDYYCTLGEGINNAGGYTIRGYAEGFISFISGSYSNVIGLPLFEALNMLNSLGINNHSKG